MYNEAATSHFKHMRPASEMTYIVSGWALNSTHSLTHSTFVRVT